MTTGQWTDTDCISRQAAMKYIDDIPFIKDNPNIGNLWKVWLENIPSVQPARIKGKWDICKNEEWVYECSECHEWSMTKHKFCPNCGADMREVSE